MQNGFPWHTPEIHHHHLASADAWWEALESLFAKAFRAVGLEEKVARSLAGKVRRAYADPRRWRLYNDTLPVLEGLSARGWRHVVLSNHVRELGEIARGLGLEPYLHRTFNSAITGYEKPHPRAFLGVLEALGDAEAVWMIGDSAEADVAGARAAGIPAILVRRPRDGIEPFCADLTGIAAVVDG